MLKASQSMISAFDVIGPVMVGPSSSHTAGALRIALLARSLLKTRIKKVEFRLYASFARTYKGHGTDRALLAGILGLKADDLKIKHAFELAKEAELEYSFIIDTASAVEHPNTVEIHIEAVNGDIVKVVGKSIGGGRAVLTCINDIDLEFTGNNDTLILPHKDRFGVLAGIVARLSERQINIASLKCGRISKGSRAVVVIELDSGLDNEDIKALQAIDSVYSCIYIQKVEI